MTSLRSIKPLPKDSMRGVTPSEIVADEPTFEWVQPRDLFVEEDYQRDLSQNSIKLIRRIVENFNWSRFKAPICCRLPETGDALVVIDGQHTAIASATHPTVGTIPVMVIAGENIRERAKAFVGHNRDRLALTQMAIFHAEAAGGDPTAVMIEQACEAAGAKILHHAVNLRNKLPAGQTIAVGTIRKIAQRDGAAMVTRVMRLLTKAGRGPIKADEIAAVHLIVTDSPKVDDDELGAIIKRHSAEKWSALGSAKTADSGGRLSYALAGLWCRELGIRLTGRKTAGAKTAAPVPTAKPPLFREPAKPAPAPVHKPAPIVQPAAPPTRPAPVPGTVPFEANPVCWNRITITVAAGLVEYSGGQVTTTIDAARLLLMLARVMPAFLDRTFICGKQRWDDFRLAENVDRLNADCAILGIRAHKVMTASLQLQIFDTGESARGIAGIAGVET